VNPVPLIPDTAPFSPEQRAWLNGFLAGVFSRTTSVQPSALSTQPTMAPLTILFGSQTGTAEGLAKKVAKEAGKRGFAATVLDMAQADLARLGAERNLLVITSTYGDGEPPDNAKALHAALKGAAQLPTSNPQLSTLRFSVCALGDTNYAQFCQCGKDLDAWLEKLGAVRVTPRADCDVDYDAPFTKWLEEALAALGSDVAGVARPEPVEAADPGPGFPVGASSLATASEDVATKVAPTISKIENRESKIENPRGYSRAKPFPATVINVRNLSGPGSAKEVNHVELSLEGSGLTYAAGDALGVVPHNCPELVADVLAALGCDGEEAVPTPAGEMPLRRALTECYDLGKPTPELLATLFPVGASSLATGSVDVATKVAPTPFHHVIDALLQSRIENPKSKIPSPADFVARLRKLQPRLYSISSSPKAHPGQVHLTVGAVRYEKDRRPRKGVCSTFLAERALAAGRVGVFVHANAAFRPPADGDTPMIMVGPGTGIAPFRAFLEERRATGARGRNWLFFGDQKVASDFLYRDELLAMRESGLLTRLDLAFSRDQDAKVYVQHRLLEQAADLHAWLEAGAHFYVCGDAARMAKDVDLALHQVIERAGGKSSDEAAAYVQALRAAKRYQRDVY
jgi:sulfite reductase (NADPH) flavoprotein alpha-component